MSSSSNRSMSHVREEWVNSVIAQLQAAAGQVDLFDRLDAQEFLVALSRSLPAAHSSAERIILRCVLLEFAGRSAAAMHRHVHQATDVNVCGFVPEALLHCFWSPKDILPRDAYNKWVHKFFAQFLDAHPVSAAMKAAHVIRRDPEKTLDLHALAHRLDTSPSRLVAEFRREYGVPIRTYQRLVRLAATLERVRLEKVEALAIELGYRSRKSFYQAFRRVTSMTPTAFRSLPPERAREITDVAILTLGSPRVAAALRRERGVQTTTGPASIAADSTRSGRRH